MYCLFECNHKLLTRNYTQYMESISPEGIPSGGGFSINRFNLDCLYSEHEKARNVWTRGNKNLPLIRYTGCEFKIYRPIHTDAVVKFQNCFPMTATELTYLSTQPYIMNMTKNSYKIKRLQDTKNKKPYKKFKFKPPQQWTNKWFFSADIYKTGLILLAATAADFTNMYISPYAETNNITIPILNTLIFKNRHFNHIPQHGYHPQDNMWLWASVNGNNPPLFKEMIFLGNTVEYRKGIPIEDLQGVTDTTKLPEAMTKYTNSKDWGNPFHEDHFNADYQLWYTPNSPQIQFGTATGTYANKTVTTKITELGFTQLHRELYFKGRYNPNRDRAQDNKVYFLKNTAEEYNWEPYDDPQKQTLITQGFPLWLLFWGLLDYHEKLKDMQHQDTDYIAVIQTKAIEPQDIHLPAFVPLDKTFTHGSSEWHENHQRTQWDNIHWFPMIHYQHSSIETIGQSGPATAKLGPYKNAELHCEYKFFFKAGGCVPPMDKITDPGKQPTFPIPTNIADPNSLQSPAEPIETYLYTFDERRGQITSTAADRIRKDYSTPKTLFTDSETTGTDVPVLQTFQETEDSEEEKEAQEKTLFQQLLDNRNKQQRLRKRIKQLLASIQHTT